MLSAIDRGERRICLTSPTGGGKSRMIQRILQEKSSAATSVGLFTDRTMLFDQLSTGLTSAGFEVGHVAAGHKPAFLKAVQLCMIQTVAQRSKRDTKWLPDLGLVVIDESHRHTADTARTIIDHYADQGVPILGVTATPLDQGGIYTHLIQAGTNSELRACGAHVPCDVLAPDEPDTKKLEKEPRTKSGEFSGRAVREAVWKYNIIGRVIENHLMVNPALRPAIAFAPSVADSRGLCEEYNRRGITAAHIDGSDVYVDGRYFPNCTEKRDEIMARSQDGEINVICNRFVLREGIDMPWLYHCVVATIFGSFQSYLQSVGRLLRSYPGIERVVLQDHGGNWWRHGDPNADVIWELNDSARGRTVRRQEAFREKQEQEPMRCPQCHAIQFDRRPDCEKCGFQRKRSVRHVTQLDGTLKQVSGDVYRRIPRRKQEDTQKLWERCFWGCRKQHLTFRACEARFFYKNRYYPTRDLKFMPVDPADWLARIEDVPFEDLIGYDEYAGRVESGAKPKAPVQKDLDF